MSGVKILIWIFLAVHLLGRKAFAASLAEQTKESCLAVVVGSEFLSSESVKALEAALLRRLSAHCRPYGHETARSFLDGESSGEAAIAEARAAVSAGRELFLGVLLDRAEEKLRLAIGLYHENHARLESYREIADARLLLGRVLLEKGRRQEAEEQFRSLLLVAPDFSPDPASLPPAQLSFFNDARKKFLQAPRGSLTIKTEPAGAQLFIDGRLAGNTPLTLKNVPSGGHYFKIRHGGHFPWEGVIQIEPDRLITQEIFLKPTPRSVLWTSDERTTIEILEDLSEKTGVGDIVLIRIDRPENMESCVVLAYNKKAGALSVAKNLSAYLEERYPPPPAPLIETAVVAEKKIPEPFLPPKSEPSPREKSESGSVFGTWWFWTIIGAAAVSTAVAVPLLVERESNLQVTIVRR